MSLIIDPHFRITQAAREVKNGPSKGEKTFSVQFFFIKEVYGRQRTHYRKEVLTWNVHSQCILMGHSSAPSANNKIKGGRLFQSFLLKETERKSGIMRGKVLLSLPQTIERINYTACLIERC